MAKLVLKLEGVVQKELPLLEATVTVGRLADNTLQIDNPAVSGHHCRIVLDQQEYFVEDNNSTNGTYVNGHRVTRTQLKNGDELMIGKHTVVFEDAAEDSGHITLSGALPRSDTTMVLDTRKAQEILNPKPPAAPAPSAAPAAAAPAAAAKDRVGTLTVLDGKTDQNQYVLSGKLTMIGKSDMATIKLKGMFAPKAAAVINRREGKYFLAAAEKSVKVSINDSPLDGPHHEIADGDIIEIAGVKMAFAYNE
jgi:pSer/pThr/pTyr-binding forkhead associated (FHA) protein